MSRRSKNRMLDRVFVQLQRERIVRIRIEVVSKDSTIIKVDPDGTGAPPKRLSFDRPILRGWTTRIHVVSADARTDIG